MHAARCLSVWLALAAGTPAFAANQAVSYATVETVQMPAWLDRDGRTQPLAVGMEVKNGDRIRTGNEARAYLKLAEGSTVKLGENATFGLYSRSLKPAQIFKGAMDVLKGAFRFTTNALQRTHSQRDLAIRVGTATAGIRGTDLWGKSDAERDLILLIEGRIEVRHVGDIFEMAEPLKYFSAPRNAPAQELTPVDPAQFEQWARETEVLPGDGAAQRGGRWRVLLASVSTQREALGIYDTARSAGYAAKIRVLSAVDGKPDKAGPWDFEVILTQLASEQEALVVAKKLKRQLGFEAVPGK
ncbi:MAG: FecR domain-containing protein [Sterolibacterium sp.]|nr:FecR domain-containing protein [Sterolibacterium sp.]